jgi:hypothetical protein
LKILDLRKGANVMTQLRSNSMLSSGAAFLFGLGIAVFGYYASSSIPEAQANPTGMQAPTSGGHPYVNLAGIYDGDSTTVLYTVPAGRILILTGIMGYTGASSTFFNILEDSSLKINRDFIVHPKMQPDNQPCNYLCQNRGHIVFGSGAQVVLEPVNSGYSHKYMIEGYLANPG